MLNYEKIKVGKSLTPRQKKFREIYLKHQANLIGPEIKPRPVLNGHKVRILDIAETHDNVDIFDSRKLLSIYIVYDGLQKANIKVHVSEQTKKDWRHGYVDRWDDAYIILGKKNIIYHKQNRHLLTSKGFYAYTNEGIFELIHIEINHRKKDLIKCYGTLSRSINEEGV